MNLKLLTSVVLLTASFGLIACDVTTTSNSVTMVRSSPGAGTYKSTVTDNGSRYLSIKSEYVYDDLATAIEECAAEKEDAKYSNDDLYTVECSGKNVVITRKIEDSDLDTYEDYYEDWCQDQKRRLKNGELDLYL